MGFYYTRSLQKGIVSMSLNFTRFMLRVSVQLSFGLAALLPQVNSAHAYYGAQSTEAWLTYEATADLPMSTSPSLEQLNDPGSAQHRNAITKLHDQIDHLMGVFQSVSFIKAFHYPASLGSEQDYEIRFRSIEPGLGRGRKKLSYDFKGKIVIKKDVFTAGQTARGDLPIILPYQADRIYSLTYDKKRKHNFCTDDHYNDDVDFFYFWDPENEGCPLKDAASDLLIRTLGTITELPNTQKTFPEYQRLYDKTVDKGVLNIWIFIGYINDLKTLKKVNRHDDAVSSMKQVESFIALSEGFEEIERKGPFREDSLGRKVVSTGGRGINYLHTFEKKIQPPGYSQPNGLKVQIHIMVGDTDIDSKDSTFHNYWQKGLQEGDIVYYDGHSGLGSNLDLSKLNAKLEQPIEPNLKKYQILFLNGCSSYPYFSEMYFDFKKGGSHLNIITAGLPTITSTAAPNMIAFLSPFIRGRSDSWQEIMDSLELSNGQEGTYLFGVKGDVK